MPISCHFRDCKAFLSVTSCGSAISSTGSLLLYGLKSRPQQKQCVNDMCTRLLCNTQQCDGRNSHSQPSDRWFDVLTIDPACDRWLSRMVRRRPTRKIIVNQSIRQSKHVYVPYVASESGALTHPPPAVPNLAAPNIKGGVPFMYM